MKKSFEDQWKSAFDEASQAPPSEVWEKISESLKEKKRVLIFWKRPLFYSGLAASIMMVLGAFWLFNQNISEINTASTSAKTNADLSLDKTESNDKIATEKNKHILNKTEPVLANKSASFDEESNTIENKPLTTQKVNSRKIKNLALISKIENNLKAIGLSSEPAINLTKENRNELHKLRSIELSNSVNSNITFKDQLAVNHFARLNPKVNRKKNGWIGFSAAGSPFNPNLSTPQFQQQAMSAVLASDPVFKSFPDVPGLIDPTYTNSARTDVQSSFKRGTAMSFGVRFGKVLKNKFSLESGVHYRKATATHNYNVYSVDTKTGEVESFFTNNYIQDKDTEKQTLISVNGSSEYVYNFISVPLFLNYNLIQVGKFNASAVAGLSGEIFINGSSKDGDQPKKKLNTKNSNFNPINLAANAGIRVSYEITQNLVLNLGTNYQHFLTSAMGKNAYVSFKPNGLGLNLGLTVNR